MAVQRRLHVEGRGGDDERREQHVSWTALARHVSLTRGLRFSSHFARISTAITALSHSLARSLHPRWRHGCSPFP